MNYSSVPLSYFSYDKNALAKLPPRPARSNKGDFGRALCICGSYGMAGAAYLCAKAAYRTGAGLVQIFTHECNRAILQTSLPEAIVTAYTDEYKKDTLLCAIERADAVVIGCGLGISPTSRAILSDTLRALEGKNIPLVIDADAINLLARNRSLLKYTKGAVMTPHFGEAARLLERPIEELLPRTCEIAREIAQRYGAVCVMKDHESAVSDGESRVYVNKSGNSGMATGGSGDVLAGILGGLLVQNAKAEIKLSPIEATALGVYIHGLAGDAAAAHLGEYSVMATDILEAIPSVLRAVK